MKPVIAPRKYRDGRVVRVYLVSSGPPKVYQVRWSKEEGGSGASQAR